MSIELACVATKFKAYRSGVNRPKYPEELWDEAVELCDKHSKKEVAKELSVCLDSIARHVKKRRKKPNASFLPINVIAGKKTARIEINGSSPMIIEFDCTHHELAELILCMQNGGKSC